MRFSAYNDYKESGIAWVGLVPEHWDIARLKNLFTLMKRTPEGSDEIVTCFRDGEVTLRRNRRTDGFTNAVHEHGYQRILSGDLVIHAMDAFAGAIGVSDSAGKSSPVYSVCSQKQIDTNVWYFGRLLRHMALRGFINSLAKGIRERSTEFRWKEASRVVVPVPPPDEQEAISSFLDRETSKIDALVAEQRRLIELLKEKRQAVISHAVTKGLDPTVPMKDSGIEWLGDVPEHWETLPMKRLVDLKSGDAITADRIDDRGDYPVYGGNGMRGYTSGFTHDGDYVLIGRQGALCGNINFATGKFWASEHAVVASPLRALDTKWLGEMVRAMNLGQYSISAAQPGLSMEIVGAVRTAVPPTDEQEKVAQYVCVQEDRLGSLMAESEQAISLLQERRTALISAAVTGKIDVRESVEKEVA